MKKLMMCLLGLVVGMASQAALAADPTEMPYMEVQTGLLPDGNWEYVYDVYGNGASWVTGIDMSGFDGTQIVNQFGPVTYSGNTGTLVQKWDRIAANNPASWNRYVYGSYSTDAANWTPLVSTDHVEPAGLDPSVWTIDNTWHSPTDYTSGSWVYPGWVSETALGFTSTTQTGSLLNGLILTFRIVHPNAPTDVDYHSYSFNNGGQHVYGTILGPGSGGIPGDFDGDGDVDADDIDDLCDNMGGDPATYDLDTDGDVDEDDMTFMVESLVEWDNGVDSGTGTKQGDFNLDGVVNATDLAIMKGTFGTSGVNYADGNANCDTVVNATDLAILKNNFGFTAPTGGGVPEPVTIGLLSLGSLGLLRRRRS